MTGAADGPPVPLRVVYCGPVPPYQGGIAQHGARLVEALRGLGHGVAVVSWASLYPRWLYPGESQVDPEAAALPGSFYSLRWWDPVSWARAGRVARHADLVVIPWVLPAQALPVRTIATAAGSTRTVAVVHNPLPHEPFPLAAPLTRFGLGAVDGMVCHAPEVVRVLRRRLGLHHPVELVGHPPNLAIEPVPPPASPPVRLLFLGFVRRYKGVDVAIGAVSELCRRGVRARLTIAGQVWQDRDELAEMIAAAPADAVELIDRYIPDDEVGELLGSHHVVVAPYHSATQSGIAPLAAAAGRPIVATRVGGLAEQVTSGRTGELVPPGDPVALADMVMEVMDALPTYTDASGTPDWTDVAVAVLAAAGVDDRTCSGVGDGTASGGAPPA